jgi:ABC-type nitrate/sulfonate/bicarbonate transport system substrate-binding protein
MTAVARGTQAAIEDPRAAAKAIAGAYLEAGKAVNEEVEATLPLLSKIGRMDAEQADGLVEWMRGQGLIRQEVPVPALLTNRYLKR